MKLWFYPFKSTLAHRMCFQRKMDPIRIFVAIISRCKFSSKTIIITFKCFPLRCQSIWLFQECSFILAPCPCFRGALLHTSVWPSGLCESHRPTPCCFPWAASMLQLLHSSTNCVGPGYCGGLTSTHSFPLFSPFIVLQLPSRRPRTKYKIEICGKLFLLSLQWILQGRAIILITAAQNDINEFEFYQHITWVKMCTGYPPSWGALKLFHGRFQFPAMRFLRQGNPVKMNGAIPCS